MPDPAPTHEFTGALGVPPTKTNGTAAPTKVSDADYGKMTTAEKAAYAAQWPQEPYLPGGAEAAGRTSTTSDTPTSNADGTTAPPAGSVQALEGDRVAINGAVYSAADLLDLAARKGAEDSRRAALPDATAYKHELPKDLKLPGGVSFNFDANDPVNGPVLKSASEWAHRNGLSQQQYSDLLGLYAASQADGAHKFKQVYEGEKAKLGVTGPARIDALDMFIKGAFPQHHETVMGKAGKSGGHFGGMLWTAAQVSFLEDVVARLTGQGIAGGFTQSGRVPPDNSGRVDQATYDRMSSHEKREYSARFDQRQFGAR